MIKSEYLPRLVDPMVERYLRVFNAVCVEGPKWCGKTWTSSYHCNSEFLVGAAEGNFQNKRLAEMSPSVVLEGETPRLLDEWQEVPPLWDAVRAETDKRAKKGQFIMTGSSTPNYKGVLHSGAGRIGRLRMYPMSLYESHDSSGKVSLQALCNGEAPSAMTGEVSLKNIAQLIIRGGWPGNLSVPAEDAGLLPKEYLHAVIEDDAHRIDGAKRNTAKMRLLLRSLARNESTTVTNKRLKSDIKAKDDEDIDDETVATYLNVFTRLFLLCNQEPFAPSIRSSVRIKQAEKRHYADPSLACAMLNLSAQGLIADLNTMGFMFEALCERDLRIYAETFGGKLYHYQDYNNKEIDAVIELDNGEWCAFEIKLGANEIEAAAQSLISTRNEIAQNGGTPPKVLCVICGLSNAAYQRSDGVFVVPITALRN